jgi:phage terminase small subunit
MGVNSYYNSMSLNLLPNRQSKRELTPQQESFLDHLFKNGGNITDAALQAGYSQGSVGWLKVSLAEEIVEKTKSLLSMGALKAANQVIRTIDNPTPERGDELRLKAAETLLNRVGLGRQETMNHNVQAIHGVVLLPPKRQTT